MTNADNSETPEVQDTIEINNEYALKRLVRAISQSRGSFSLILVRCNHSRLRQEILCRLKQQCQFELQELYLPATVKTLYSTIQAELGDQHPEALLVFGLESVTAIDQVLTAANQVREEFRKHFSFPIVLWLDNRLLQKWIHFAPDFKSWAATPIRFETNTSSLLQDLSQTITEIFTAVLDTGAGRFQGRKETGLSAATLRFQGLESALDEVRDRGFNLPLRLAAGVQFLTGRKADSQGNKTQARAAYEESALLWQQQLQATDTTIEDELYLACVWFHLGLWWRQAAILHQVDAPEALVKARDYYQQCLQSFQAANRPDLIARFINALGEILTRLEQWERLQQVAQTAVSLHQTHHSPPIRLAYGYGLQARVALQQSLGAEAKRLAELALYHNNQPVDEDWQWDQKHYRGLYLLLLAQAKQILKEFAAAIADLEAAKAGNDPQYDPFLSVQILATLRSLYFQQGQYREAFQNKQEQRSIEQQYGLRAFVGAGRLQSRRQVVNPSLGNVAQPISVTQEIAASGRMQDINRLVERISRHDCKLTVIYGQSGVGKSSLVQAGLLPVLKQRSVDARVVLPVLLQVYSEWEKALGGSYTKTYTEIRGVQLPGLLDSMATFVVELRSNAEHNLLTVLIFDQFEEFFFAYRDPIQRRPFFQFLRDCLNIPYVKVILSLREDYLHYLLECNRLTHLDAIDNNILDKNILYYLGNLSPKDARAVIQNLTETSQIHLNPDLIDSLVVDLAGNLGEVRPIELQVVGDQLQTENISTLAEYQTRGPKEALVERFLAGVVQDCGPENEAFAKIILYLLTDESNTRPLKTQAELTADLALDPDRLDLILTILVRSGLVFLIPGFPAERYQLVHDYLVPFIRQQQSAALVAELRQERERRVQKEAELNQFLQKRLRETRVAIGVIAVLAGAATLFGLIAATRAINNRLELQSKSVENLLGPDKFEALVASIRAGKNLKHSIGIDANNRFKVLTNLQAAIHSIRERNSLTGHRKSVISLSIHPEGKSFASASADGTIKLWSMDGKENGTIQGKGDSSSKINPAIISVAFSPNGKLLVSADNKGTINLWRFNRQNSKYEELKSFKGHPEDIFHIEFSPDSNQIISTGADEAVKIWDLKGKLLQTLKSNKGVALDARFSPDGKMIAVAYDDGSIVLWTAAGKQLRTFENTHTVNAIAFSPNSQFIASGSSDNVVRLWDLQGREIQTFVGHKRRVNSVTFSPDGKLIASTSADNTIKLWSLDGAELYMFRGHFDQVKDSCFSKDGKILISASMDDTIKLWDVKPREFQRYRGHLSSVESVKFSPDHQHLASASSSDKTIKLWSLDGREVRTFTGYSGWTDGISFSPNSKTIAAAVGNDIKLWNLEGKELQTFKAHSGNVWSISFSPNGKFLASASSDKTIKLWNLKGEVIHTFSKGHDDSINSVKFSPDSQSIISASSDNRVILWSIDGRKLHTFFHDNWVSSVDFSPDGGLIASVGGDDTIRVWRRDGQEQWKKKQREQINSVRFSPDGSKVLSASSDNSVTIWDSRNGRKLRTMRGHFGEVYSADFSPDRKMIVSAGREPTIKLWNLDGLLIRRFPNFANSRQVAVSRLAFDPSGNNLLVTANKDNTLTLWNTEGEKLRIFKGHSDYIYSVRFSPKGRIFASSSADGTIKLWSLKGTNPHTLQGHEGDVYDISFDPTGSFFASSGFDGKIKLWNVDGKLIRTFKEQSVSIKAISFSPDGKTLASAREDGTIQQWNLKGNELLPPIKNQTSLINQIIFSPDGKLLASAMNDGVIKLWKLDGNLARKLRGHSGTVFNIHFSPDDQQLISSSYDDTVKFWDLNGNSPHTLRINHFIREGVLDADFSPDMQTIAFANDEDGLVLWHLDLDRLLQQACSKVYDYLKTSSTINESDRHLCDDIK